MRDRLVQLGWSKIEVIDEDLGCSAAGGTTRAGFERMVAEVCLGKVGAVAAHGNPEASFNTIPMLASWLGSVRIALCEALLGTNVPTAPMLDRLGALRARIRSEVTARCWNFVRGHFVDHLGGERLDASLLLMPLVGFLPADDPRISATIDSIERELSEYGLVWRRPHGGDTDEGAFIACSCWLADCRALQGRRDQAVALLERVLSLRNDMGLLSETYHPGRRRLMGNFPQALSHLAVINTALGLSGPVLQRGGG